MLTQTIEKYAPPLQRVKPKFVQGSEAHKHYILRRAVEAVYNTKEYDCGEEWMYKGKLGCIIGIAETLKEVEWEGMKAKFIELFFFEDNSVELAHFADLKKPKGN
jgi:hypothetical protein